MGRPFLSWSSGGYTWTYVYISLVVLIDRQSIHFTTLSIVSANVLSDFS